jgi:hypothetical protein
MPVHDWTRVEAGIFHHFHHSWIEELQRALNDGVLPEQFYAMAEQHAVGYEPDVLALQYLHPPEHDDDRTPSASGGGGGLLLAEPKTTWSGESEFAFYRRKQNSISVRHVSDDDVVAMIEVSPGNKSGPKAVEEFVKKACALLANDIHLLVLDVLPPSNSNPHGIHAKIWEAVDGTDPGWIGKPYIFSSYEASTGVRAFAEAIELGQLLPDMPLFLEPRGPVEVPLEKTYRSAFAALPRRWRNVVAAD